MVERKISQVYGLKNKEDLEMKFQYKIKVNVNSLVDETTIIKMGFIKEWDNSDWTLKDERCIVFDTATEIDEKTTNAVWTIEKMEEK